MSDAPPVEAPPEDPPVETPPPPEPEPDAADDTDVCDVCGLRGRAVGHH